MDGDNANVWEDSELKIDADPFCTSCKISSMNKKAKSKLPLKPKSPFKLVFMDIIPSTAPKSLNNDTNIKNYLLIVDANRRRYCQFMGRCRAKNRCRPFLHFMQIFFIE